MITVILDQLQQVKLLSTAKQQHITTSRYKSLQANREKKVQLCFESTSLTSKGQSREVLKEKLSASHSPLVLCKLAALWNSSLSWNTTREKQSTCMLEMRNELSQLQQENAKTSMQHAVASSTSPHNVKERMQSRFLHPVRFPTSQCKVKVCIERVCVSVRVCLTVSTLQVYCFHFHETMWCQHCSGEMQFYRISSHDHPTNTNHKENILCELIHTIYI